MTESNHNAESPYFENPKTQIIDKKADKWESVLLHLAVLSILLPSAAEANCAGLIGLTFLFRKRWKGIRASGEVFRLFWIMIKGLALTWGFLLASCFIEGFLTGDWGESKQYFRLIGKQGIWGSFVVATFIAHQNIRQRHFLKTKAVLLMLCFNLGYCLVQRYSGIDWVHGWGAQLGDHRLAYDVYRVSGWMGHPLTFANNLMLFTLLSFSHALFLFQRARNGEMKDWFLISIVLFITLCITGSRFAQFLTTVLLALSSFIQLPSWRRYFWILTGLSIIGTGLTLAVVEKQDLGRWGELVDKRSSLEERFDRIVFWKVHWHIIQESPWFGTGLGPYKPRLLDTYNQAGYTSLERKYNAHNIYLQTLTDMGLLGGIGLLAFFATLGRLAHAVWKKYKHPAIALIFAATLGGGVLQNNLRDSEYLFGLWTCIGLCLSWLIVQGKTNESKSRSKLQDFQP